MEAGQIFRPSVMKAYLVSTKAAGQSIAIECREPKFDITAGRLFLGQEWKYRNGLVGGLALDFNASPPASSRRISMPS